MMEFKVNFKSSDDTMKADFGVVTELSAWQKKEYESRIAKLEGELLNSFISGVESGKSIMYDTFWDEYQEKGKRTNYAKGFAGSGWTDVTFTPKYSICPVDTAHRMFESAKITDLGAALERNGVYMDFSKVKRTDYAFYFSEILSLPDLDIHSATNVEYMFYRAEKLHTIKKLVLADDGSQELGIRFFFRCYVLENIRIEGLIGCDLDIHYSPLSKDSIIDIVWHLSPEASDKTVTLARSAVNKAFETSEGANDGADSQEWGDMRRNRPMWLFTLV